MIKLCILIYTRTNCGLRTVVKILEIFGEVFEGKCGKVPCHNTVENWMRMPKPKPVVRWTKLAPMLSKNMERRMLLIAIIQDVSWDDLPIGYRSYIGNQQRHKELLP